MSKIFRHLTLSDRIEIERMLSVSYSATRIGEILNFDRTTISREVKRGIVSGGRAKAYGKHWNGCVHQKRCKLSGVCDKDWCKRRCASCRHTNCTKFCSEFRMDICKRTLRWPYSCNGCPEYSSCACPRYLYKAAVADVRASELLVLSRQGHDLSFDELDLVVTLAKPMLANNLSPSVIWKAHGDKMPCSERTFYRLVHDMSLDGITTMNLPFAVRYKMRKQQTHSSKSNIKKEYLEGRSYADFCALDASEQACAVEMDCVIGHASDTQALLTLFWREFSFQIAILLESHDIDSVTHHLGLLERSLMEHFPYIMLCDRGQEFSNPHLIEQRKYPSYKEDELRTKLYYCDARRSDQKARCENAHRLIRRVLPKGNVYFDDLFEEQIALMNCHVNSMPRTSLNGRCPMSLAMERLPEQFFCDFHLELIDPTKIILKPHLLGIC